jgi:hypothetical protein
VVVQQERVKRVVGTVLQLGQPQEVLGLSILVVAAVGQVMVVLLVLVVLAVPAS